MAPQTLTEPTPVAATASSTPVDCFGADNGTINLTISGGTGPYTQAWTGPSGFTSTDEDISGLAPGAYSVTVTDAQSCATLFSDIATITEPSEIQVTSVKSDISCGGLSDGSIAITVSGGVGPYGFAWTGPSGFTSSSEDLSGLAAGSYNLTITDANGCIMNFPTLETIVEPTAVVVTLASQVNVACYGNSTGSIDIDVAGGTAPYSFLWRNAGGSSVSSDEDPVGLPADSYSVVVTDNNGCTYAFNNLATISEPTPLSSTLTPTHIQCYGDGNGIITIATTGGTGPYEYSRLGDLGPTYQPVASFNGLGSGFYTVWTRDANLCVVTDTVTIQEPEELQILGETKSGQNKCYGDSLAQISIDAVTGGVQPYEYSINGGVDFSASPIFTQLPAGNYQTVVRDASGCTSSGNLNVITQPTAIRITGFSKVNITTCFDDLTGRIIISGAGGTGSLSYGLNSTLTQSTGDFQNLPGGSHLVEIEDDNLCVKDTTVVLTAPPPITVDVLTLTHVTGCPGNANGSISVSASGGSGSIN
ncbi:MAG: SprB repeat-containing protein [Bacteroidales bacterium]